MESKICRICLIEYALSGFYKHNKTKDGLFNECKNCVKQNSKVYHKENSIKIAERSKIYRLKNREYFNKKSKDWNVKTGYGKKYQQDRLKNDLFFKFKNRLRTLIRISITKQGYTKKSKTFKILGCDYNTIIKHLESKFKNGMNWENYGLWHIDHIIPISSAKTEDEVIKLNHYTNLQPLWAIDNLKKYNKNETFKQQEQ
jgi:hypothetical protein